MKRLLLALLTALVFASPAFAIVGGPWDNNVPGNPVPVNPSNIEGTYQGTLKGKNIAGTMRFSSTQSGIVTITSTSTFPILDYWGYIVGTGTSVTKTTSAASGFAHFFFEGKTGIATVDTSIDLGARKISGIIEGAGFRTVSQTLVRPATKTSGLTTWNLQDSVYFNGYFSAKFAKQWAKNSFSGKGTLTVTKFDFDAWNAALVANPSGADPQSCIVTVPTSIKVSGVKSTDEPTAFEPATLVPALPLVTLSGSGATL